MLPRDKHLRALTTPRVLLHLVSCTFRSSNYIKRRFLKFAVQLRVCRTPPPPQLSHPCRFTYTSGEKLHAGSTLTATLLITVALNPLRALPSPSPTFFF